MAYKKLIKVSNVCQVFDKRKYPATGTDRGITFTNNGDGSITVNGTATGEYYSLYTINVNLDSVIHGHIYAILGSATNIQTVIIGNYVGGYIFKNSNSIYTFPNHEYTRIVYEIRVILGVNFSNVIIKPQLFDLTEMYGAGHEPTSVEQFRQDFPEELYDYSPHCWLTSYKRVFMTGGGNYLTSYQRNLTCKTKNLFDINSYNINNFSNITINGNSILCVARAANAHVLYRVPTVIGEKYTVSNKSFVRGGLVNTGNYGLLLSDNPNRDSSNYLTFGLQSGQSFTLTAKSEFLYIHWYVCYTFDSNNPSTIEINELQVNLGDTATNYVPYGHL